MQFKLNQSIEILERTPFILEQYLSGLSDDWLKGNEGSDTWSPYDILGHLIYGEKTDWLVRIDLILSDSEDKMFEPFDRFAQLNEDQDKSVAILLNEFRELRKVNIEMLKSFNIQESDYSRKGVHPDFGDVTLKQLISTWVVHDLSHIAQISRVMSKRYKYEVGPWINYLGILRK